MTWRDDLLPATLGGQEFLYKSVGTRGGRRNVAFEFPGRDEPFIEDLGRKARRYELRAFLLGDNYHVARNDFMDMLEAGGNHQFQHPYLGIFTVQVLGDFEVIEADEQGGMAEIRFTLVESGLAFPLTATATPALVTDLAEIALTSLAANTKFDLIGAISDVVNSVLTGVNEVNSFMRATNGSIASALALVETATATLNDFEKNALSLLAAPGNLINALTGLGTTTLGLIKNFTPDLNPDGEVIEAVLDLPGITLGEFRKLDAVVTQPAAIPTPTEQSLIEQVAHAEITFNNKAGSLANTADVIANVPLESANQAAEIMVELAAAFDVILGTEDLAPDIFESFYALKAATIQHLTIVSQDLPQLTTFTPNKTVPTLLIAYELYGDANRDAEIIARNRIRHPGFTPGGIPLEVVSTDD